MAERVLDQATLQGWFDAERGDLTALGYRVAEWLDGAREEEERG